jgi:capsular exopolysaccharide synthesis family protein
MTESQDFDYPIKHEGGSDLPAVDYREFIPDNTKEEIHLKDYLEVLLRRKWLIIGILFFTFLSTLIFSLAAEKQYEATGSLEVNQGAQKITKFEDVVTDKLRFEEFVATQASLLKSDTLAEKVIDKLNLADHPVILEKKEKSDNIGLLDHAKAFIKKIIQKKDDRTQDEAASEALSQAMVQKALLKFFKERLTVTPQRDAMIINIAFTSPDRWLSEDAVNMLMDEFVNWKMDQKIDASEKAREFLMRQIDQAKINLESAEEKQNKFAKQAGIVSMDAKLNSVFRQLEDINTALGVAEADFAKKETIYRQAVKDGPSSLPQVLNSSLINQLKSDYAGLRSEYERLTEIFRDDYPDVKAIRSRMNSIETQINDESQKIFNSIKYEYEAALSLVKSLNEKFEEKKLQAMDLNERATQYKIMEREVETNKAIYQSLLERAREIESMAGGAPNIQIVDRATLPIFPSTPNVKLNLLLAIVMGLTAGVGGALLMEYFADTITNPDQISDRFQIPILGVIPVEKECPDYPLELAFSNNPRAGISEALLTSRVSIQLSVSDAQAKCIAVTSTSPGEGKTTISANLAQTFAGAGEKVVIIDADLRKPRMHKIFPETTIKSNGYGLSNYLAGISNEKLVAKTEIENIFLIRSGPPPPNPVELLASSKFTALVKSLSKTFDRIIVDSPPHQGLADILVISRQVGGIILVSGIGECTREGLRHFKKSMENVRGNVLGCIVNKFNPNQSYGHKYYHYHYQYGPKKPGVKELTDA